MTATTRFSSVSSNMNKSTSAHIFRRRAIDMPVSMELIGGVPLFGYTRLQFLICLLS